MRHIFLCLFLFICTDSFIQANNCLLFPKTIEDQVTDNTLVVEGAIVAKEAYYDATYKRIYTSNTIQIHKIFKGELDVEEIVLITEGGTIGNKMQVVTPSLEVQEGEVGLFFLNPAPYEKKPTNIVETMPFYYPNDNALSFIKYDDFGQEAVGVFEKYTNIEEELYQRIQTQTQDTYKSIEPLTFKAKKENGNTALKTVSVPVVDCMEPDVISAGTESILTIHGSGFGVYGTGCSIEFKNPNDGGITNKAVPANHIVSWGDNEIQVMVPTKAGSGVVKVITAVGMNTTSIGEVLIPFSRARLGSSQKPTFYITPTTGKYEMKYSINTASGGVNFANSPAVQAVERAIDNLQQNAGFDIEIQGTTMVNQIGDDGVNTIMFDNDATPLVSAGQLYAQFDNCGNGYELTDLDVVFRRENTGYPLIKWNYTSAAPNWDEVDLESVALHELTHGMQLKHVLEEDAVMYYVYAFGVMRRELLPCYDIAGANLVREQSTAYTPACSYHTPYTPHANYDPSNNTIACPTPNACSNNGGNAFIDGEVMAKLFLEGLYEGNNVMNTDLLEQGLLPNTQPFNIAPWNYQGTEQVMTFPNNTVDWVLVELQSYENGVYTSVGKKAALLNNMGYIMDVDGTPIVIFDNLEVGTAYHIVIHHLTHLSVVSSEPAIFPMTTYDFTTSISQAMGAAQLKEEGGMYCLYAGDYDGNGVITNQDYNRWKEYSALVGNYVSWDGDGNGVINNQDYNLWSINRSKIGASLIQLP